MLKYFSFLIIALNLQANCWHSFLRLSVKALDNYPQEKKILKLAPLFSELALIKKEKRGNVRNFYYDELLPIINTQYDQLDAVERIKLLTTAYQALGAEIFHPSLKSRLMSFFIDGEYINLKLDDLAKITSLARIYPVGKKIPNAPLLSVLNRNYDSLYQGKLDEIKKLLGLIERLQLSEIDQVEAKSLLTRIDNSLSHDHPEVRLQTEQYLVLYRIAKAVDSDILISKYQNNVILRSNFSSKPENVVITLLNRIQAKEIEVSQQNIFDIISGIGARKQVSEQLIRRFFIFLNEANKKYPDTMLKDYAQHSVAETFKNYIFNKNKDDLNLIESALYDMARFNITLDENTMRYIERTYRLNRDKLSNKALIGALSYSRQIEFQGSVFKGIVRKRAASFFEGEVTNQQLIPFVRLLYLISLSHRTTPGKLINRLRTALNEGKVNTNQLMKLSPLDRRYLYISIQLVLLRKNIDVYPELQQFVERFILQESHGKNPFFNSLGNKINQAVKTEFEVGEYIIETGEKAVVVSDRHSFMVRMTQANMFGMKSIGAQKYYNQMIEEIIDEIGFKLIKVEENGELNQVIREIENRMDEIETNLE